MANPNMYGGLAGSLAARAHKPPMQNDVYMQQPRGSGRPPQQFGGSPTPYGNQLQQLASKPGLGGPYGSATQQGFTPGAGFGGGIAGINATGGFQNPVSMSPPMGGGMPAPGGGPSFGGGPAPFPSYDPLKDQKPAGGGPTMLGPPTPMQVPGFGGGPQFGGVTGSAQDGQLEDFRRPPIGRRFP